MLDFVEGHLGVKEDGLVGLCAMEVVKALTAFSVDVVDAPTSISGKQCCGIEWCIGLVD